MNYNIFKVILSCLFLVTTLSGCGIKFSYLEEGERKFLLEAESKPIKDVKKGEEKEKLKEIFFKLLLAFDYAGSAQGLYIHSLFVRKEHKPYDAFTCKDRVKKHAQLLSDHNKKMKKFIKANKELVLDQLSNINAKEFYRCLESLPDFKNVLLKKFQCDKDLSQNQKADIDAEALSSLGKNVDEQNLCVKYYMQMIALRNFM